LYVGGIDERINAENLREKFYYFGEIKNISIKSAQNCAFVEFTTRAAAESAADKLFNSLIIEGLQLRLSWAKPPKEDNANMGPPPLPGFTNDNYYPSMDPQRLGSLPMGPQRPNAKGTNNNMDLGFNSDMFSSINSAPLVNTAPDVSD